MLHRDIIWSTLPLPILLELAGVPGVARVNKVTISQKTL